MTTHYIYFWTIHSRCIECISTWIPSWCSWNISVFGNFVPINKMYWSTSIAGLKTQGLLHDGSTAPIVDPYSIPPPGLQTTPVAIPTTSTTYYQQTQDNGFGAHNRVSKALNISINWCYRLVFCKEWAILLYTRSLLAKCEWAPYVWIDPHSESFLCETIFLVHEKVCKDCWTQIKTE